MPPTRPNNITEHTSKVGVVYFEHLRRRLFPAHCWVLLHTHLHGHLARLVSSCGWSKGHVTSKGGWYSPLSEPSSSEYMLRRPNTLRKYQDMELTLQRTALQKWSCNILQDLHVPVFLSSSFLPSFPPIPI